MRHTSRSAPRLAALLFGTVLSVVLLACAEGGFYLLNQPSKTQVHDSQYAQSDTLLGYKAFADARSTSKKIRLTDGRVIYDVVYSTDAHGRRITPGAAGDRPRDGVIVYFGCSITFGEGVNDDETMPSRVAELAPGYRPYNYAFRGYGPQQMLAKLQSASLTKEIERTGRAIGVYTFINDHVRRAIGSVRVLYFAHRHPYYTVVNGVLVRNGDFGSGRPISTPIYRVLAHSQTLKFFNIDWPVVTDAHVQLTASMITESSRLFLEQFGGDFYVLIYPGSAQFGKQLIPYLEQAGVRYLDYSNAAVERLVGDGHPTASGHRTVAGRLAADLKLRGDPQADGQAPPFTGLRTP